ncbi:MAG: hypothetical protein ACRDFC_09695 [Ignavibacteria bacterium]
MMKEQIELLNYELALLNKATEILKYSFEKCKNLEGKKEFSLNELDNLESLTSRFARLSDLLIQKIFRLIDGIELEDSGTIRDRINRAEKRNIIDSADILTEIRILRNNIAHEYLPEAITEIYKNVIKYTPNLLKFCEATISFCKKYKVA